MASPELPQESQRPPTPALGRSRSERRRQVLLEVAAVEAVFSMAWALLANAAAGWLMRDPLALAEWRSRSPLYFAASAVLVGAMAYAWRASRPRSQGQGTSDASVASGPVMAFPTADAVLVVDASRRVTVFNASAEKMFQCPGERALGQELGRFVKGDLDHGGEGMLQLTGVKEGGVEFPLEVSVSPLSGSSGDLRMLVVRDVSSRVLHEAELNRLKRLYAALSQINQAIVWTRDRDELLGKICEVLGDFGGFKMAWIGTREADTSRLVPIASWGDADGYLKSVEIFVDDRPEGRGPTGVAFRENRTYVCNDLFSDPATVPFREHSRKHGFRSAAAFPIRKAGDTWGTLTVYADEAGIFQEKEIALLSEAAFDISFALDSLIGVEERKRAEAAAESERLFSHAMIDSMPGILYFYNEQGRFLRWNRNFEIVSGYSAEEIAKMHPLDFFSPADQGPLTERIAEVFEKGESAVEAPFLSKDGRKTPYYFTGRRLDFQGMRCLVGVGIDISERKRGEMKLRELAATLEVRVEERTAELQEALVRAEAADRLKSTFLATMSHELRTPLNSIIGFTGIVLRGLAGPLNAEQTKQLSMVRGSARHLLELINDVLDLSKIEAGQLKVLREPFDLRAASEHTVELVRPLAEKKALALHLSVDPELHEMTSDRRRVEQILLNLLNNAVKFTQTGSVSLAVERVAEHRCSPEVEAVPAVRLRVIDTGIGIKPEDMGVLFKPFQQLDTGLAREHEGTGLGLAICRRLAALLGGEITAESVLGKGSTFTVILPLKQTE